LGGLPGDLGVEELLLLIVRGVEVEVGFEQLDSLLIDLILLV